MARGEHTSPQYTKYPKRRDSRKKSLAIIKANDIILKKLK